MTQAPEPFSALPRNHYEVIYADPPWRFLTRSNKGKGRSPERHYAGGCMSLADIKALPVPALAADDCALFLWVTDPVLPWAFEVISAWGFTYKTVGFYWVKTNGQGRPHIGQGYWTRANPEQCLLATRGRPKRQAKDVPRLVTAPVREHSRKPDEVPRRITRLMGAHTTKLELFGRERRSNWDLWGDESERFAA